MVNQLTQTEKLADATRAAMLALGLELFSPSAASDGVTAVMVPGGIDGEKLVKIMRDEYGVTIAGGQGEMKTDRKLLFDAPRFKEVEDVCLE